MPRAAIERGYANRVVSLDALTEYSDRTLRLSSAPCTVKEQFPVRSDGHDVRSFMEQFPALLRATDLQPVRYLVVDDSVFARKNLARIIESYGGHAGCRGR